MLLSQKDECSVLPSTRLLYVNQIEKVPAYTAAIAARTLCQLLLRAAGTGAGRARRAAGAVWQAAEETVRAGEGQKNTAVSFASHCAASAAACGSDWRARRSFPARKSASQYKMAASGRQGEAF